MGKLSKELSDIKELLQNLPIIPDSDALLLKEKVINVYNQKIKNSLSKLLKSIDDSEDEIQELQNFLTENWNFTKGTALSYTALPNGDVTHLMCKIANIVCKPLEEGQKKTMFAIQALMPGVNFESLNPIKFPHLQYIEPEPGAFDVEVTEIEPQKILRTHILSRKFDMLIPIRMMINFKKVNAESEYFVKPYYDYSLKGSTVNLDKDEIYRITHHSLMTEKFSDAVNDLSNLENKSNSLLSKINELCSKLYLNSSSGRGAEAMAGEEVYTAIINFNAYYEKLSLKQQKEIPNIVNYELKNFLNIASNKAGGIETCIANRRSALLKIIKNKNIASICSQISIDGSGQGELITETNRLVEDIRKDLDDSISNGSYHHGEDKLGLTIKLLDNLSIKLTINSIDDLSQILRLSEEEVMNICVNNEMINVLIKPINNINDLTVILMDAPDLTLEIFLKAASDKLIRKINFNAQRLSSVLSLYEDEQKIKIILNAFINIIESEENFCDVLKELNDFQISILCESFKYNFKEIITSVYDFLDIVKCLNEFQISIVCESIKHDINHIVNVADFGYILREINETKMKVVCDSLKDSFIKSGDDFKKALSWFNDENKQKIVFDSLKDNFKDIIKSKEDFVSVLEYLNKFQVKLLCILLKDNFEDIIKSKDDLRFVLKSLGEFQRSEISDLLKDHLKNIINLEQDLDETNFPDDLDEISIRLKL
tara:strand:- start:8350 stop:10491 length:2142 start_codon:yes stop_codon:yes gene_type:complete